LLESNQVGQLCQRLNIPRAGGIWRPLFNPFDSLIGEVQRRAVSSERPLQVMARFFLQRMRQAMVNRIMYAMNDDWPVSDDHGCKMNESARGSIAPKRTQKSRTVRQQTLKKLEKREMLVLSI
jgi:hypothetical protein